MMPTTYHTSLMTTDAETNKYFSSPIGTLATPAVVTRETFDTVSCIPIRFGVETPTVNFAGAGGGTAFADMQAAVGAHPNGTVAFCYAINPAQHGRYVRTSGAWVRTGPIVALHEHDNNHKNVVVDLMLGCQTGYNTAHPLLANDGPGPFVDKVAYPNILDMTNHKMVLTTRAVNLKVPSNFKIGMHHQGELRTAPKQGTGNGGAGAFPLVNAMNHCDILGKFGFGNSGIFADNTVNYVADSGWVRIEIPFSPSDAQWSMMLGNEDKDGHEGAAFAGALRYIGTDAKTFVGPDLWPINSYLCGFRWNVMRGVPGANTVRPAVAPDFEPTGTIYISKIEFIAP